MGEEPVAVSMLDGNLDDPCGCPPILWFWNSKSRNAHIFPSILRRHVGYVFDKNVLQSLFAILPGDTTMWESGGQMLKKMRTWMTHSDRWTTNWVPLFYGPTWPWTFPKPFSTHVEVKQACRDTPREGWDSQIDAASWRCKRPLECVWRLLTLSCCLFGWKRSDYALWVSFGKRVCHYADCLWPGSHQPDMVVGGNMTIRWGHLEFDSKHS